VRTFCQENDATLPRRRNNWLVRIFITEIEKLEAEAEAVLAWAAAGWRDYKARGEKLDEPPGVLVATKKYRTDSDDVGRFLNDKRWIVKSAKATTSVLHAGYLLWAKEEGRRAPAEMLAAERTRLHPLPGHPLHGGVRRGPHGAGEHGRWWRSSTARIRCRTTLMRATVWVRPPPGSGGDGARRRRRAGRDRPPEVGVVQQPVDGWRWPASWASARRILRVCKLELIAMERFS
jgi:hypothetical protein